MPPINAHICPCILSYMPYMACVCVRWTTWSHLVVCFAQLWAFLNTLHCESLLTLYSAKSCSVTFFFHKINIIKYLYDMYRYRISICSMVGCIYILLVDGRAAISNLFFIF